MIHLLSGCTVSTWSSMKIITVCPKILVHFYIGSFSISKNSKNFFSGIFDHFCCGYFDKSSHYIFLKIDIELDSNL